MARSFCPFVSRHLLSTAEVSGTAGGGGGGHRIQWREPAPGQGTKRRAGIQGLRRSPTLSSTGSASPVFFFLLRKCLL